MKKLLFSLLAVMVSVPTLLAQNVGVDVATPEQKLDVAGAIKVGNTTNGVAGSLRWNGTSFQFHDGTQWITLNANTDDQQFDVIQLNGTDLELSIEDDGQATYTVDLSSFLDNTDAQQFDQVSINGSNQLLLSLSNDGQATHVLDLSGYLDNTDEQGFDIVQLSGTNLELSLQNDGVGTHVIDLSSLAVDTDDQTFDVAQLIGTNLELSLEDDGVPTEVIDLSSLADNTDDQQFDVINITSDELRLSLEDDGQATHVLDLSPYKDNTDDQTFDVVQLTGNNLELSLEDDGQATHTIDLSGFADNTDDQTIDVLSLAGNTLNISLEDDAQANQTLDLSQFMDNTDDQQLNDFSLSGNTLSLNIEDAGGIQTVDLSGYLDNTDNQTIDVFNLSGNDLQLSIEDDAQATQTVDLSGYLDNTDDQSVTDFSLSGTTLSLQVESDAGGVQTVDLASLQRGLEDADGDTKVEVEATADEDQIRFTTAGGEAMRINTTQQVGIGLTTGIENKLVVNGSNSDSRAVLGLRGGNQVTTFNGGPQIAFGYDGDDAFQHFIHTRHNSAGGATNNAIDFYVSDGTQYNTVTTGSTHVMSLNSGNVGIGTTTPDQQLEVIGNVRVSSLAGPNELVISDAQGDLVNTNSLVGTGMGDNLGNHTATTNLNMTNREIDNITQLDMTAGNGNGIRFWSSNSYKMSMGNSTEYRYGPVTDYSIKTAMSSTNERGWTWGVNGSTPVAAINTRGHMALRGSLFLDCADCGSTSAAYPNGGSGWGDMVIQGRVLSTNSNLHLSPPGGSYVIIDDVYRAAGGTTAGSAGLQVQNLGTGANRVVLANASGQLYAGTLDGTGLGDNLGNHSATTTLQLNNNLVTEVAQLRFNDNVRFQDEGNDRYIRLRYGNTGAGGMIFYDGNDARQGYVYAGGDQNSFGLLDADGQWAVRIDNNDYVELYDNGESMFRAGAGGVGGNYGSVVTRGGGKAGWEGYSINDRYVLMSDDNNTVGLYNDVNNRWIMLHERDSYTRFYEPDGGDYIEINTNTDMNFRDNSILDANLVETNILRDGDGSDRIEVEDDFDLNDRDIWDVQEMTVNTIDDTDGTNLVHFDQTYMRFDVGSTRDIWFDQWDGNHPQIRPGTAGYGFNGRFNNYWYETYTLRIWRNQEYFFSDRRVKKNIRDLEGNESLGKIMSIRPVIYDINEETHPTLGENPPEHVLKDNIGFIAQELMEVVPEAVILDDRTGFYAIKNVEQLLPIVIEAMQEQQNHIKQLHERLERLEKGSSK